MQFFSSQKIYTKVVSFFVSFLFLIESAALPIITFLPRAASAAVLPEGYVDSVTSDSQWCGISGWAWDADSPNAPLTIHLYRDRDTNDSGGVFITAITANVFRQDLANAGKGNGYHGFHYLFNSSSGLFDGSQHNLFVYALDAANPGASTRLPSSQSGLTVHSIRCSEVFSSSPPVVSLSSANFSAGTPLTAVMTNAAPNAPVFLNILGPDGFPLSEQAGITDGSGRFSKIYPTDGWSPGSYQGWARVSNVKSNVVWFTVVSATGGSVANQPVLSFSQTSISAGDSFTGTVAGAAPNAQIRIFSKGPDGVTAEDAPGTTSSTGTFSRTYSTAGWNAGSYQAWVTVNGVQSNVANFTVSSTSVSSAVPVYSKQGALNTADAGFLAWMLSAVPASWYSNLKGIYVDGGDGVHAYDPWSTQQINIFGSQITPATEDAFPADATQHASVSQFRAVATHEFGHQIALTAATTRGFQGRISDLLSRAGSSHLNYLRSMFGDAFFQQYPQEFVASMTNQWWADSEKTILWGLDNFLVGRPEPMNQALLLLDIFSSSPATALGFRAGTTGSPEKISLTVTRGSNGMPVRIQGSTIDISLTVDSAGHVISAGKTSSAPAPVLGSIGISGTPVTFAAGAPFTVSVVGGAPNTTVNLYCRDPQNAVCDDPVAYITDGSGKFTHTYDTTGWTIGAYQGWAVVNSIKSNAITFTVTAPSPSLNVSPTTFQAGATVLMVGVTNAVPNATVKVFCRDPNGSICDDPASYVVNPLGQVSHAYDTTGWTAGSYRGWVTVNGVQSNIVTFTVTAPPVQTGVLPVGATAVYKGNAKVWVASRINADTILFERWDDPLSSTNTVWRSKSQDGAIASESSSEIYYRPVTFYDHGTPADTFGTSDGPYDVWLTPTGLYTAYSGQQKTLAGVRIGYGTLPAFYSRQWCGLGTICNKSLAEDKWDGWPILGFILQKQGGTDVASIFTGPFWLGFEIIQATLANNGTSKELRGQPYSPCSAWTTTLGLCKDGSLYMAGANEVLRVKLDEQNLQWWYDWNSDGSVDCDEFGKTGAQYPRDAVVPHGVAIKLVDRNSPTRAESSWTASREGICTTPAVISAVLFPLLSVSPSSFTAGTSFTGTIAGAAPNAQIRIFSKGPDGATAEDAPGTTSSTGTFSRTYDTTGWTPGAYQAWVTVNGVQSNVATFSVTASASNAFTITTASLPQATVGTPYSASVGASGGTGSYGWQIISGNLPPGLSVTAGNCAQVPCRLPLQITGTPALAGTYSFSAVVSDSTATSSVRQFTITVSFVPAVSGTTFAIRPLSVTLAANQTQLLSAQFTPAGGAAQDVTNQTQWSSLNPAIVELGTPPGGAVNNTALGKAVGTATIAATYQGQTAQAQITVGQGVPLQPFLSVSPAIFSAGVPFTVSVVNGAPNATVKIFCRDPHNAVCDDSVSYATNASGQFTHTYDTAGWTAGAYRGWVTVNNLQSNEAAFTVTAAISPPAVTGRVAPTPTTAPMATLTFKRDQEKVTPDKQVSFSGTLDSSQVAFPQGSSLFTAIPDGVTVNHIEMDGRTLASSEFSASNGGIKIPFSNALYNGSHSFRLVLQNALPVQLDRLVSVWVSVIDANSKLLLKGRTASIMVARLPTEVIGKGVSLTVPNTVIGALPDGTFCCWVSADPTHFPIRNFSFGEMDITRGPFFTPNPIPVLPDNIAFTLFPGDAAMQRIGLSLKQFSDPLSREFITAQYQYLLGRDPSSDEMSRYLPSFTQWQNPLVALAEVYNRRADVRQAVLVPRDAHIGGDNSGSSLPSYDKFLEWAATKGWQEEPSLASFKLQNGFDNGWQLFQELWGKYEPLAGYGSPYDSGYGDVFKADAAINPLPAIAYLCNTSNLNHGHYAQNASDPIDFKFCWQNDPMMRHRAILWAKDGGWAYNQFVKYTSTVSGTGIPSDPVVVTINPSGPILAPMFAPGTYSEYAAEQQWRYPPAQLYYDLISSPEYQSFIQQRFRANIDSVYRLFFGRPAGESDIAWVKNKFIGGLASFEFPDSQSFGYAYYQSWINDHWEPNGLLIASNFTYVDEVAFLKNRGYITDDVYGIRYIPGEIDAVSSRLVEMIERKGRQELYQGDNFKHVVSGLYRLYLRRNPTDAELEERRASGKNFGDIEFALNQSAEYGKTPASSDAIKSLYRNYLGRDPNDADVAQWGDKTISSIADTLGKSADMKAYAQQHPENAYIFPIKKIKIVKCGFFCSILGRIVGVALMVISFVFPNPITFYISLDYTIASATPYLNSVARVNGIVLNSLSRSFSESGFNGETFVQWVSIARSMAGQAGGVFSMTNLFENADPTILDGFRTMARAPQNNEFVEMDLQAPQYGLASLLGAASELLNAKQFGQSSGAASAHLAQIDVSGHYGGGPTGSVAPVSSKNSKTRQPGVVAITKNLVRGSSGKEVLLLQKTLGEIDLTFLPQYRTGYYGLKTEAAVKRFQKRYGLEQVGYVGLKTRALLNSYVR